MLIYHVIQQLVSFWSQSFVMRSCLILVLFFVSVETVKGCKSICSFLYSNSDWKVHSSKADTYFEVSVTTGSVTGIITASFETFTKDYGADFDFLRFIKFGDSYNEYNQPLIFLLNENGRNVDIRGKRNGRDAVGNIFLIFTMIRSIQISDLTPDFYRIYLGDSVTTKSLEYKYKDASEWDNFQDNEVRLKDTRMIKSDGRCTVYKYISACTDPTPRLCDKQLVTENVTLGSPYTLTCTGSGAPYLDVKWTRNKTTDGTNVNWNSTYDNTTADHEIVSTLQIDKISIDHLGEWNCTILNKNFGHSVTKTYIVRYSHQVSPINLPGDFYSNSTGKDTLFQWVVEGWPLEQVIIDCGNDGNLTEDKSGYTTSIPPQVVLKLTLKNEDKVNCVVKDGENVLDTREITRVGYNCTEGEGGVGKGCEVCEPGQTSVAGVGECFAGNTSCTEGYWGTEENCRRCPDNKTSTPQAVKLQECFPDVSYCTEGLYGYENNCSVCPQGETSKPQTKKATGCFTPKTPPTPVTDTDLLIPIGGGAGGLVAVLIFVVILCLVLRRKKTKEFQVGEPIEIKFVGTTEINAVFSDDPVQNTIPSLPCDLEDSECAYAVINKQLTQKKCASQDTEIKLQSQQSDLSDGTYAVLNKDYLKRTSHKTRMQEPITTECNEDPQKMASLAGSSPEVTYAKLGEVKRLHFTDNDKEEDEEGAYACLKRPGSVKSAHESRKMVSHIGGVELEEDPLYADMEDRNPIAYSDIPVDKIGNDNGKFKSSLNRSVTVEDEDDTYARVELSDTSQLRAKQTATLAHNERAEYCTILEFQRRKSYEEDRVDMDNEYG